MKTKTVLHSILVSGALAFAATSASAVTYVTMTNDEQFSQASENDAGVRGTVTCSAACTALYLTGTSDYSFKAEGEFFGGPSSSGYQDELDWANMVLGLSGSDIYTKSTSTKTPSASSNTDYMTSAMYVILKIGNEPDYTILRNDSGGELTFSYAKAEGSQGGLSHFVELGEVSQVPLPASLPLLLAGLGGVGAIVRRKRKAA